MRITQRQLRQIIREELVSATLLAESNSAPLYTGIVLSKGGVEQLREKIYELGLIEQIEGWETSNIAEHGNEQLNHHMTLTPGALKPNDPLRSMLGEPIPLTVVSWGVEHTLGAAGWRVVPPEGFPIKSGNPHITAALASPTVKPFMASKIKTWEPLAEPFTIMGTLAEVFDRRDEIV